jgi:hypothetical protein
LRIPHAVTSVVPDVQTIICPVEQSDYGKAR